MTCLARVNSGLWSERASTYNNEFYQDKVMCQMNVVLDQDGEQEKIMDNVTHLQVTGEGVLVSTFFEEP